MKIGSHGQAALWKSPRGIPLPYAGEDDRTGAPGLIVSLSGIRGVPNRDLSLEDVSRFAANFGRAVGSNKFLLARDSRTTGTAVSRSAAAGLLSLGATVLDYGIISTPALFRESRMRKLPAVMVTASHNEPEFNGLKFIDDGTGIGESILEAVVGRETPRSGFAGGLMKSAGTPRYVADIVERFGAGTCEGVEAAVDLGGGAAISHAVPLLSKLGCHVTSLNDTYSIFARRIDPVADDLDLLVRTVKSKGCDIGLGFDCDGDRLVVVDSEGRKRTGDYMLTLALSRLLAETGEKQVVVSMDTTQAVDDVAGKSGCRVARSKVGEANVVGAMKRVGARLGGEGSSGGLIDGTFNHCRDSMLAAVAIVQELKVRGRSFYRSVPVYHQERVALQLQKAKALKAMKKLAREYDEVDTTDGLRVALPQKSWVLIRPSGTEDVVRVSAEASSPARAASLAESFAKRLKELSR